MNNYLCLVINMDKNIDRLQNFDKYMKKTDVKYTRIPAVDGKKSKVTYSCAWDGMKGLIESNKKCFDYIIDNKLLEQYDWFIIFEDDAEVPVDFKNKISNFLYNNSAQIIWLNKHNNFVSQDFIKLKKVMKQITKMLFYILLFILISTIIFNFINIICKLKYNNKFIVYLQLFIVTYIIIYQCMIHTYKLYPPETNTGSIVYHKSIIKRLNNDINDKNKNNFINNYKEQKLIRKDNACPWDLFLYNYVIDYKINWDILPIVPNINNKFVSEVQ